MAAGHRSLILAAFVITTLSTPAFAGVAFLLAPASVDLEVRPGETREFQLNVVNEGTEAGTFVLLAKDLAQDVDGYSFDEPNPENPYSAVPWLRIEPSEITLQPGDAAVINGVVSVPRDARGTRYAGILCELKADESPPEAGVAKVRVRWSMASILTVAIGGTRALLLGEITDLRAEKPERNEGTVRITATFRNNSEVHVYAHGTVTLRHADGTRVGDFPLGGGRGMVLPHSEVKYTSLFTRYFRPGDYTAEARITYGGARGPAVATVPFTIGEERIASGAMIEQVMFEVLPSGWGFETRPGGLEAINARVINLEDRPITIEVEPRAMEITPQGQMVVLDSADAPYSVAPLINVDPKTFELAPERERNIRYILRVPREITGGGRYGVLTVTASAVDDDGTERRSSVYLPIMLTLPDAPRPVASVESLRTLYDPNAKQLLVQMIAENESDIHFKAMNAKVTLHSKVEAQRQEVEGDEEGPEIVEGETELFRQIAETELPVLGRIVLPESQGVFTGVVSKELPPGEYRLDLVFNYGGERPAIASHRFTIEGEDEAQTPPRPQAAVEPSVRRG